MFCESDRSDSLSNSYLSISWVFCFLQFLKYNNNSPLDTYQFPSSLLARFIYQVLTSQRANPTWLLGDPLLMGTPTKIIRKIRAILT